MAGNRRMEIMRGLACAHSNSMRTRLLTFTDDYSSGEFSRGLHLEDFQKRISRFIDNLRRDKRNLYWDAHYSTLAFCPTSGRLHRHVVTIGGAFLPPSVLRVHERRAGIGHVDVLAFPQATTGQREPGRHLRDYYAASSRFNVANYLVFGEGNGFDFARAHVDAPHVQTFSKSRWP